MQQQKERERDEPSDRWVPNKGPVFPPFTDALVPTSMQATMCFAPLRPWRTCRPLGDALSTFARRTGAGLSTSYRRGTLGFGQWSLVWRDLLGLVVLYFIPDPIDLSARRRERCSAWSMVEVQRNAADSIGWVTAAVVLDTK